MVYRPRYPWHFDALSIVYRLPTHRILTHLYPWYFDPLSMVYWPLPMLYRPPTHGILTTLPMVF
jgi:hypothetical protein